MYIEMANLNQEVRKWLTKKFNEIDIYDEELFITILEEFDYIKKCNKNFYNQILRTTYQDYKLFSIFEHYNYVECKDILDIEEKIEEDPTFYGDLLRFSFEFYNSEYLRKREVLLETKSKFNEIKKINPPYVIDILNFTRNLTKDDIICCYYEKYKKIEGSNIDKEVYALDDAIDLLYGIFDKDNDNYKKVATEIVNDAYLFIKSEEDKRKLQKYQYKILNTIEKNDIDYVIGLIDSDNDEFFTDIVDSFIQYNKKPIEEQKKIKQKIKKRGNK